ncbi:MAG: ABC-F family ATP-binding cassette domain-containing protein [Minisyncoccia bacterium]
MLTISLKNIHLAFLEKTIFDGASFKCNDTEKICIVGENGTGKSTLLKILLGEVKPDEGNIEKDSRIRTHYVPQEFSKENLNMTIEEFITKYGTPAVFKKTFGFGSRLGYNLEKNLSKKCGLLSGGQQKILALSVGLAVAPDFLLLDEPENHLDIVSRVELIALLSNYRGGVLFVSHDRMIMDGVADRVAEVHNGKIFISEGGYEAYNEARELRIAGAQRVFDTEQKRVRQMESSLGILQSKAFRGKGVSQYLDRKEEIAEIKEKHSINGRPEDKKTKIVLQKSGSQLHGGKLICRIENGIFHYPNHNGDIFRNLNLEIRSGTHIVLLGRNGSGKSTLLKCLMGLLPMSEGTIEWNPGVKRAYFDQHTEFEPNLTPLEIVQKELACDNKDARHVLGMMKFSSEKMDKPIRTLSGGERMRIRFGLVFGAKPDFIILDEPTNHLDETTWQILLDACNASASTILLVTHDYEFIDEMESKFFWLIKNQTITEQHKDLSELVEVLRSN